MNRRFKLAAALLAGVAMVSTAQAQIPAVPGAGAAGAAPKGAAPAGGAAGGGLVQNIGEQKCCSVWDKLGVKQIGKFGKGLLNTTLGQALLNTLAPAGKVLGLGPSLMSDKFANSSNPAMAEAAKKKKEAAEAPLKVKAIKYLATLDCTCYPEVVNALLAPLKLDSYDCAEIVRYEALKALHKKCGGKQCKNQCAGGSDCPSTCEDCRGCQCQKQVIVVLNDLLLARDKESGCLKERSQRIRELATQMIEECLALKQPPPQVEAKAEQKPIKEAKPDVKPSAKPDTKNTGYEPAPSRSLFQGFFKAKSTEQIVEPAISPKVESVQKHTAGYRGVPARQWQPVENVEEVRSASPVLVEPVGVKQRSGQRHLIGEVFGY